jgi:O-antigen ligase
MTAVADRPAPSAPGQVTAAGEPAGRRFDAVTILTVWVVLLMYIPATLVVAPLGAVGGPATIFAAVVLVIYLVTWLHPKLAPAKGRQPVRAAAILLTCAVIGTYVSTNRHIVPGLERNGLDRGIILICGWLGVLIMASDGIPSMERLKKLFGRVVIAATAMSILGITQFFTGLDATQYIIIPGLKQQSLNTDLLSRNGLNRPSATAAHPLEFACVLAMVLPIALNRARFAPPGKRGIRWTQVGLIAAALPLTLSRSAVLAILALVFVLLPTWPKVERRIAYVVMVLGVAGLWMLVPGLIGTFRTLFATLSGDTSTTSRTGALSKAQPFIAQHPWFGHGFGTFFPASYFFTDDQYVLSLIEIGVVGLFCLLALFITGLVTAQRVRHATNDPEMRDLGQSLTATIAVAMVAFGTFDALSFNMAAGLTFLFLGCTGAALRLLKAQGAQPSGGLAGQLMTQPDQEPPTLTHRPGSDEPDGLGAAGAPGELYGLAGLRAGQQTNGRPGGPDERRPDEKPSEQSNGHLPPPAGRQPGRPAGPQPEEEAGAQVEKLIGRYLGERTDGKPEQQADGQPAEPGEAAAKRPAEAAPEPPAGAAPERPAWAAAEEPAQAQVDKPYWENQLWPWEPQDLQPAPRPEDEPAEAREEEQPAKALQEEPVQARQEEPAQEEQPAKAPVEVPEAHVEQPEAHAEVPEAHAEAPDLLAGRPTVQAEVPDLPAGPPTVQAEVPDLPAGPPTVQAEVPDLPAGSPAVRAEVPGLPKRRPAAPPERPAAEQPEQPAARAERPAQPEAERAAEAPWDPWRKPGPSTAQPTTAAADEQAAAPAGQPAAEPAEARAERPGKAPWDAWRKPGPSTAQPTTAAADEQTAADQPPVERVGQPAAEAGEQAPEPAGQPEPEPPGERPEESTIPIPIIRD